MRSKRSMKSIIGGLGGVFEEKNKRRGGLTVDDGYEGR